MSAPGPSVATVFTCLGCGAESAGRSSRKFCSNRCQRDAERRHNLARWLATGALGTPPTKPDHFVRRHLAEEQGHRCAVCGRPPVWEGRPLAFVMDHVNGDAADNRRENLRLVCPNCDSQLPTFKMRNRGRGRHARRERYAEGRSY